MANGYLPHLGRGLKEKIMTNKEILTKALEKAEANGFGLGRRGFDKSIEEWYKVGFIHPRVILFDHDFAKAFWGEQIKSPSGEMYRYSYMARKAGKKDFPLMKVIKEGWQYHLQQMVLEEDPIKYLEKFL